MKKSTTKGFTLIELAVALTIVALVVGGLAVPLSKRLAEQQYTDTQATLDKATESLVGFAVLNRRLPCPDVRTLGSVVDDRDGAEDSILAAGLVTGCNAGFSGLNSDPTGASWGELPWQTIGLAPPNNQDAWNNRLRYAVFTPLVTQIPNAAFVCPGAAAAVAGFANIGCTAPLGAFAAQLAIRCGNPANLAAYVAPPGCIPAAVGPAVGNFVVSNNAVFVVYSVGANGFGGTPMNSLITTPFPAGFVATSDQGANAPELEIAASGGTTALNRRRQFVTRARTDATSNSGEFDDLLTFMSSNTLAAKLLNAGVYP